MSPFFSIIIPVYNVAPYLRECLDSVIAQTFTDWEVICVDDGSTDESGVILDEYAKRDKRFKVVHQENAGVSAARNVALDLIQSSSYDGGYVWFVDSDDAIHPNALEFLKFQFSLHHKAQMLCFRGYIQAESVPKEWPKLDNRLLRFEDEINSVSYNYAHASAWMSVFSRKAVATQRFEAFSMSEDTLFIESALWLIGGAICGDIPIYCYRMRPGQATGDASLRKAREWLLVENKLADHIACFASTLQIAGLQDFFHKRRNQIWYTHKNMLFCLPVSDISQCVCMWVDLQRKRQLLYRETLYRRVVLQIMRLMPSAFLLKTLVWHLPHIYVKFRFVRKET